MSSLEARGLRYRYPTTGRTTVGDRAAAIDDVSMSLAPGRLVALTGPSGSGKTTLLWLLAKLLEPEVGTVRLGDTAITDLSTAQRVGIALVPQGNGLAASLTARENVPLPLLARTRRRRAQAAAGERSDTALDAVGLRESGGHLIEELSGGQQQRVAIARGLALAPAVLLADEPTSELDHGNRERVLHLLRGVAERGATVLMATHDPEAAALADAQIALDEGRRV